MSHIALSYLQCSVHIRRIIWWLLSIVGYFFLISICLPISDHIKRLPLYYETNKMQQTVKLFSRKKLCFKKQPKHEWKMNKNLWEKWKKEKRNFNFNKNNKMGNASSVKEHKKDGKFIFINMIIIFFIPIIIIRLSFGWYDQLDTV